MWSVYNMLAQVTMVKMWVWKRWNKKQSFLSHSTNVLLTETKVFVKPLRGK